VIFVDTNVFMYAVGRAHPLQAEARHFFEQSATVPQALFTSAEVLQEMLHAYLPVDRLSTIDAAFELVARSTVEVWSLEADDVRLVRQLRNQFPELSARDLCHFACCRRRGVSQIKTFDRGLSVIADRHL
tara:strand:+ start:160 stop:549 length:390 start_codon:yes stop_codon:yes gene_type:complete